MDIESVVHSIIHEPEKFVRSRAELRRLPDETVSAYVSELKSKVDSNWSKDLKESLRCANLIIGIGCLRNDRATLALGMMARGDTVKFMGQMQDAWDTLQLAGELYQQDEDEIGWARTRIGRLYLGPNLDRVAEVLTDADTAREIFLRHKAFDRILRLDLNTGYLFQENGSYQEALAAYLRAIAAASVVKDGKDHFAMLYMNIGGTYLDLGNFSLSERYLKNALKEYEQYDKGIGLISTQLNLAGLAQLRGHYRESLNILLSLDYVNSEDVPVQYIQVQRVLCETYLALNRFIDARKLASTTIDVCRQTMDIKQELGYMLQFLAVAQAEGGKFDEAQKALEEAEALFKFLKAQSWVADCWLKRGQIALRQKDLETALNEARRAAAYFDDNQQILNYAIARLLEGQAAYAQGDMAGALTAGQKALASARKARAPWLRYSGHVLLGQIAERQNRTRHAISRYRAAVGTLERTQRQLTITLRPEFLQDKLEGLRGLMRVYLAKGDNAQAFNALECTKSQVLMNHLSNHEHLHWRQNDSRSRGLVDQLEQMRAEHHAHYEIAYRLSASAQRSTTDEQRERSRQAVADYETRIRATTEQLYVMNHNSLIGTTAALTLPTIQSHLPDGAVMIEFYNDAQQMWAFVVDQQGLAIYLLPMSVRDLTKQIKNFQRRTTTALVMCEKLGALSPTTNTLTQGIQRELSLMYEGILKPLEHHFQDASRLIIVPYGELHYLPFHLLYDGANYLIEQHEVVVLPSAALLTVEAPQRIGGVRILGHSSQGELPQTLVEAAMVQTVLGGEMHCEEDARRNVLFAPPSKVLHIAAHGQYRFDNPDLSFIQLADGQLYTDDLLQHDMSYELVTLSACETGRSKVAPGDELIGLGRGFLYAGAGALITSLWRVDDNITVTLMEHLYHGLQQGESKAAALRNAQLRLLEGTPNLHPAFWGAFQLVGNPNPLSSI